LNNIVIVDGNSLINRAYFAMRELKNSKGMYTGGINGLTNMIYKLMNDFNPTHFVVAFDMKGPTFRHKQYDQYKGTRKGMPDELAMQLPAMKSILDAMTISRVEFSGYEADDLIGTIAQHAAEHGLKAHVITGDKDALQLVSEHVHVHITKKGVSQLLTYTDDLIIEEWGVDSKHVTDFKGLSGDSSDNIPGIPGIGPKTASKLLNHFDTVENLILCSDQIENKRIRGLVETYADQALISKKLATIFTDVPIDLDYNYFLIKEPNRELLVQYFIEYELNGLLKNMTTEIKTIEVPLNNEHFNAFRSTEILINELESNPVFYFKLYYEKPLNYQFENISLSIKSGDKVYFLDKIEDIMRLKPILESDQIKKIGYELKQDIICLKSLGITLKGTVFDGYIASYLINPARSNYELSNIMLEMKGIRIDDETDVWGKGAKKLKFSEVDQNRLGSFAMAQVKAMEIIYPTLLKGLKDQSLETLYRDIEHPLIEVLADIEVTGFSISPNEIDDLDEKIQSEIKAHESEIYYLAGETFNINSPKQLGVILFEKLQLPPMKKTKTGYSTSHDILEKLTDKHPIVNAVIEYRMYTKLKSTYIDGFKNVIDRQGQRVHTSLNQTIAVTGRLSSTEPNLQNIPIRLPYGRKIRKFFIPDEGCTLLSADYSQIELRILAHLSEDQRLVEAFENNLDIHAITASQVFHVDLESVTSLQRSRAKEVNFGIVYGMGDYGLSESLQISRKEAKLYIESYFQSYPRVKTYMDEIIEKCKIDGYVSTLFGRRRHISDINHSNFMLRSAAERTARNTPIQGTAADIIKIAMIKVYRALNDSHLKSKLILQVHDELIINVVNEEMETVKKMLQLCMEEACQLKVPLKVDMNTGVSWYDTK